MFMITLLCDCCPMLCFFKQKTAYEMRISDWSSYVCSSDLTQVFALAGRMMAKRVMGKASFVQIQDMSGRVQIFVQQNAIGAEIYDAFKTYDVGDIIGVRDRKSTRLNSSH